MKLYDFALSGHAHRVRLFLSLLGVEAELIEVDIAGGGLRRPEFLALNPFGQVPVLEDDGVILSDSNAILVYLATRHNRRDWLPEDPVALARVQKWLSVAAGEIAYGPCAARLVTVFGAAFGTEEVIARAHRILTLIEAELAHAAFITGPRPTIADIALYSYIVVAPEGNVDLHPYPQIALWLARVEALPGFLAFPETKAGLRA